MHIEDLMDEPFLLFRTESGSLWTATDKLWARSSQSYRNLDSNLWQCSDTDTSLIDMLQTRV
jgi:hypothetical protein